jgi:hypothetical protein
MGLRLPGALERLLNDLGYTWPEVDEDHLLSIGQAWTGLSGTLSGAASQADGQAQSVWAANVGQGIDAFRGAWGAQRAPSPNLRNAADSSTVVGAGMMGAAAIVLALKMNVIVQLSLLAAEIIEAIATAPETFGASLLEIPVFKEITGRIINGLIMEAVNALMQA